MLLLYYTICLLLECHVMHTTHNSSISKNYSHFVQSTHSAIPIIIFSTSSPYSVERYIPTSPYKHKIIDYHHNQHLTLYFNNIFHTHEEENNSKCFRIHTVSNNNYYNNGYLDASCVAENYKCIIYHVLNFLIG